MGRYRKRTNGGGMFIAKMKILSAEVPAKVIPSKDGTTVVGVDLFSERR